MSWLKKIQNWNNIYTWFSTTSLVERDIIISTFGAFVWKPKPIKSHQRIITRYQKFHDIFVKIKSSFKVDNVNKINAEMSMILKFKNAPRKKKKE